MADGEHKTILLNGCRRCTPASATYALGDSPSSSSSKSLAGGGTVTILFGAPPAGCRYKAISHVSGPTAKDLTLQCTQCRGRTPVALSSVRHFRDMMRLAGAGSTVWLDVVSLPTATTGVAVAVVDQEEEDQRRRQLNVMGDIYANAESVCVLLPAMDVASFEKLGEVLDLGSTLVRHERLFLEGPHFGEAVDKETQALLSQTMTQFFAAISALDWITATFRGAGIGNPFQWLEPRPVIYSVEPTDYSYWKRAWTFQEWALAQDVEVMLEEEGGDGEGEDAVAAAAAAAAAATSTSSSVTEIEKQAPRPVLRHLKETARRAAVMMAHYKLQQSSSDDRLRMQLTRSSAQALVTKVKRLFPSEEAFLVAEEVSQRRVQAELTSPLRGTDELLGVVTVLGKNKIRKGGSKEQSAAAKNNSSLSKQQQRSRDRFRVRLITMLDAFASGMQKRSARPADLVASWAKMARLDYDYDEDDPADEALAKAVRAVRAQAGRVYQFQVLGGAPPDIDLAFSCYSWTHAQSNARGAMELAGLPIFTGRCDTIVHLLASIRRSTVLGSSPSATPTSTPGGMPGTPMSEIESFVSGGGYSAGGGMASPPRALYAASTVGIDVVAVQGAGVELLPLSYREAVLNRFALVVSGSTGGIAGSLYGNLLEQIGNALNDVSPDDLAAHDICFALVPHLPNKNFSFPSWAVVPRVYLDQVRDLGAGAVFVGRESLNGTLVLAAASAAGTYILAYLVVTDNQCGSYLIPSTPGGRVHVGFHPQKTDYLAATLPDRAIDAKLSFKGQKRSLLTACLGR